MDNKKEIEIRSDEVQEILGGVPPRIVRYGVMSIFLVFCILIIATFVIKYPDVVYSPIVVTTEQPPAPIISRASGKIENLFVSEQEKVAKGAVLGIIENPASFDDFQQLQKMLQKAKQYILNIEILDSLKFGANMQLGPIQDEYSFFVRKVNDFKNFRGLDYYPKLNKSLEEEKSMSRIYYDRLYAQRNTFENEYNLARSQFVRDSNLYSGNVLPAREFENSKAEMLSKKNSFEGAKTKLAETQMEIYALDQRIIENQKNHIDQQKNYELEIDEAYQNLVAAVNEWELNYVLKAPVDGVVSFNKFWSETQNVKEGDRVLTIIPENPGELIGRVQLPIRGSGKIRPGLDVNIKFDNYPYMEFGTVRGEVKNISMVPEDNSYTVEVFFPEGLVTTYGNKLELQNQISGQAEIIAEDLRLIQRILNPLKSLWKERVVSEQ